MNKIRSFNSRVTKPGILMPYLPISPLSAPTILFLSEHRKIDSSR
jgi:hypothetical protein